MYTIKINDYEQDGTKLKFKETSYFEADNIHLKEYFDDSKEGILPLIQKEYENSNCIYINTEKDSYRAVVLGFFKADETFHRLMIFNPAHIYIMQNGKTIDKIIV